jgi:hypothetical protein
MTTNTESTGWVRDPERSLVDVLRDSDACDDHYAVIAALELRPGEATSDVRLSVFSSERQHLGPGLADEALAELHEALFVALKQIFGWETE